MRGGHGAKARFRQLRAMLGLLSVMAIGCGPTRLPFLSGPGGALIFAALNAKGELLRFGLLVEPSAGAAEAELEGETLLTWQLAPSALVDEHGVPLAEEALDGLSVREISAAADTAGSCGRCLAPALRSPQVMMPGDSCSVPRFAEGRAFDRRGEALVERTTELGVLDEMRPRLRLERPGECPCPRPSPIDYRDLRATTVRPAAAPRYFGAVAAAGTSSLTAFAVDAIRVFDPIAGTDRQMSWQNEPGLLPTSVVRVGDAFLLSSTDDRPNRAGAYRLEWVRLGASTIDRQDLGTVVDSQSHAASLRHVVPGPRAPVRRAYAFGDDGSSGQRGAIAHCDEGAARCEPEVIECVNIFSGNDIVQDLTWDEEVGGFAAARRHLLHQAHAGDAWRCINLNDFDVLAQAARGPEAFVVCGDINDRVAIGTAAVQGRLPAPSELHVVWTSTFAVAKCAGTWTTPSGFSVVLANDEISEVVQLDRQGRVVDLDRSARALGPGVVSVERLGDGRLLGRSRGNGLSLGPVGGRLARIYGDADSDGGRYVIADLDGEDAWFVSSPPLELAHVTSSTMAIFPSDRPTPARPWAVRMAARDHSAPPDRPRFATIIETAVANRQLGMVELIDGKAHASTPAGVDAIAVAEQFPGVFVLLQKDAHVLRWSPGEAAIELEGSWDDPSTPEVEVAYDRAEGPVEATGGHGVVWFSVSHKAVVRVAGSRFEVYPHTVADGQELRSADASCPDDPAMSMSGTHVEFSNYLRLSAAAIGSTDLVPHKLSDAGLVLSDLGVFVGAAPDGDGAAVVSEPGVLLRFGDRSPARLSLPGPVRSARLRSGFGVAGGNGRIIVLR